MENGELVRKAFEAFNDGDPSVFLDLYDPDVVLRVSEPFIEAGTYFGAEAVERYYTQFFAPFGGTYRLEMEKLIEVGDSVLTVQKAKARGRRSGATVESASVPWITTMRGGRIIRIDHPASVEEAFEIVGLPEAMSQENVELASKILDALGKRDPARLIALSDPEVEWHSFFALAEGGVYRGHDGAQRFMSDLNDAWEIGYAEVDDGLGVGDVAVLVGRIHFRGRRSGVESESPAGWVLKFRAGKLLCFRAFREPAQALEAVGLSK